jgi:hypothetical protein
VQYAWAYYTRNTKQSECEFGCEKYWTKERNYEAVKQFSGMLPV